MGNHQSRSQGLAIFSSLLAWYSIRDGRVHALHQTIHLGSGWSCHVPQVLPRPLSVFQTDSTCVAGTICPLYFRFAIVVPRRVPEIAEGPPIARTGGPGERCASDQAGCLHIRSRVRAAAASSSFDHVFIKVGEEGECHSSATALANRLRV